MNKQHHISFIGYFSSLLLLSTIWGVAYAGPRGSEFDLTLAPAAGGMEGASVRPGRRMPSECCSPIRPP